jgi:hypothetical protein
MSSSMVPVMAPHPLLVGTFGDLVSRRPLLARLAGLFGLHPIFQCPTLATLSLSLSYESSLLTVSTPALPPPLWRLRAPSCGQGRRNDASPPRAFLQGVPPKISGSLPLLLSLAACRGFQHPALATLLSYKSLSSTVSTPVLGAPLADACGLLWLRRKRNDASLPCALQGVSLAIFGLLTLLSSLAACRGGLTPEPLPSRLGQWPGWLSCGRASSGCAKPCGAPFRQFSASFCQCGTHHQSCLSAVSLPKGRLDLEDCRSQYVFT